jgi:hypothetical protein
MPRRRAIGWLLLAGLSLGATLPFAKGPLEKIDLQQHRVVIRETTGLREFAYTERTYFYRGKQKLSPDQLVTGEVVAVRFRTDDTGRQVITHLKIGILPPAEEEP